MQYNYTLSKQKWIDHDSFEKENMDMNSILKLDSYRNLDHHPH